jgi:hypothetical protein
MRDRDSVPAKKPTAGLDAYCRRAGGWLTAAVGVLIGYVVLDNPGLWTGILFLMLISIAIKMVATNVVNVYIVAFVDKEREIPVARVKILRKIACAVISLPLLFPAYGACKGGYEVLTSERQGSRYIVDMFRYKMTCSDMNWFSRLGYRLAYHSLLDFKEDEDDIKRHDNYMFGSNVDNTGVNDIECAQEVSTALMEGNFVLARQWACRIKNERDRRWQLALINSQEELKKSQEKLQKSIKETQDAIRLQNLINQGY